MNSHSYRLVSQNFSSLFSAMSSNDKEVIRRAINAVHAQTCIRLRPAVVGDKSIIRFRNSSDCSYFIGRRLGIRTVRIEESYYCKANFNLSPTRAKK